MPKLDSDETRAILAWLDRTGIVATPKVLTYDLDLSYDQIKRRLPELREAGLVQYPPNTPDGVSETGVYELTERGERFVSGDMTLAELRELRDGLE